MTLEEFFSTIGGQIIIQCIGFCAMTLGILSFQRKTRVSILAFQMIASTLWALQFLLLGGYTGALQNVLCIIRGIVLMQKGKHKWASSYYTLAGIILCFAASGFITIGIEGAWALLPIAGSIASSAAQFATKEKTLRKLSLIVSPLWLIYNVHTLSVAGIVCETFTIISIFIALYRFKEKPSHVSETCDAAQN